jgi:NitT/TauT family transport system ATP-binding protein
VAIVGTSGCGKSTLLNMIAGLNRPTGGKVSVFGRKVDGIAPRVGYMFQTDSLLPWRSVIANVEVGLELAGIPKAKRREAALKQLAEIGLRGFENHWPSELSGGMRQRASLARTWLTEPEILLMDEPFGALDSQTKLMIQEAFLSVWEKKRQTVLLVTHDIEEAIAMADRVIVMSARPGQIKSQYLIELERPRSLVALRSDPRFHHYWQQIWSDLEEGARRSFSSESAV